MLQKNHQIPTWAALAKVVEEQFEPSQFDCLRALLFKLVQLDSVAQYYSDFMVLANRVDGLSDTALLDRFMSGLKYDCKQIQPS